MIEAAIQELRHFIEIIVGIRLCAYEGRRSIRQNHLVVLPIDCLSIVCIGYDEQVVWSVDGFRNSHRLCLCVGFINTKSCKIVEGSQKIGS